MEREEKASLLYSRMITKKCRRNDRVRKSSTKEISAIPGE